MSITDHIYREPSIYRSTEFKKFAAQWKADNAKAKAEAKGSKNIKSAGTRLKDIYPGSWYTSGGSARFKKHLADFVHKDKILKYGAAFGLGGATVTAILIGVGVIKVGAIGGFLASPAGHGVLIGLGVGAAVVGGIWLGTVIRRKLRERSAIRRAFTEQMKNEAYKNQPAAKPGKVPAMDEKLQQAYTPSQQDPFADPQTGMNNHAAWTAPFFPQGNPAPFTPNSNNPYNNQDPRFGDQQR